jgi:hypothetical protein
MNDEALLNALQTISRIINNLNYECSARIYTLDDDEMGDIFYCRELADEALRNHKEDIIIQ